jgi:hypothetical protein
MPSPAMTVAGAALVIALAGTAMAAPTAIKSILNKQEKKQVKNIAKNQVNKLAPGLSVANAANATNATNANNANTLGGSSLADVAKVAGGNDSSCVPGADFVTDCDNTDLTINRTSDIFLIVTGNINSDDGEFLNFQANCRIERNDVDVSTFDYEYGSSSDDTDSTANYQRALAITEVNADLPPGTYSYELSCDVNEGDFDLENLETTAIALGS